MAKPKNGKAKRIYKEQAQVQAVQHEEIKAQQRKSSTRFNRWVFGLLALLFLSGAGFAVAESRAVQAERINNQARSIDDEDVDPKTWRSLKLVMSKSDGGKVEIGLSRPTWWIEQAGAEEGKTINLDIPEMKMSGPTKVLSVSRLPYDDVRGDGTVTGTFKHTSADVLDLQLQGEKKPIGVTSSHPFRSADRDDWVPAGQLKVSERVVTRNGTTKVVTVKKRPGQEPVYNLEVHGTHTYFVGSTGGGAWVHNTCVADDIANGHAFEKHILNKNEFAGLEIRTRPQFSKFIDDIMTNAQGADAKALSGGRTAYWDSATETVVIHNPRAVDAGTAFRPTNGRSYFDNLR